jgi:hypothetical protein
MKRLEEKLGRWEGRNGPLVLSKRLGLAFGFRFGNASPLMVKKS